MRVLVWSVSPLSRPLSAALAASCGCRGTGRRSCSARPAVPVAGPWCHTPTTARRPRVVSGQFLLLPLLPDRHLLDSEGLIIPIPLSVRNPCPERGLGVPVFQHVQ
eukprot:251689-Rhodomonas_salina.1